MTSHTCHEQQDRLLIRLHFTTNWGVNTGVGSRGLVNSSVETDALGYPMVRATVLTGIMREQAEAVAAALDRDGKEGSGSTEWQTFVAGLFGARGAQTDQSTMQGQGVISQGTTARRIHFVDALIPEERRGELRKQTTEAVSISIDPETGSVKDDFFRTIERATANELCADMVFVDTDEQGNPVTWTEEQRHSVRFVLTLAATLVRGIGSDRSAGDGQCTVLVGEFADAGLNVDEAREQQRQWCKQQLQRYISLTGTQQEDSVGPTRTRQRQPTGDPDLCTTLPAAASQVRRAPLVGVSQSDSDTMSEIRLILHLSNPVVSYEVPMSNEVRTLDFIRGTTLLPWVHRRLRAAALDSDIVRDAVVSGDLYVSDATLIAHADGLASLPVPLCLSRSKALGDEAREVLNRLHGKPPVNDGVEETFVPLRGGFLTMEQTTAAPDTPSEYRVAFANPLLTSRQSSAHNAVTGATSDGQLFMVRALAAGQSFGAQVTLSARLRSALDGIDLVRVLSGDARLGSRKLTGAYGQVRCRAEQPRSVLERPSYWNTEGPWDTQDATTTTLWCVSDLLVRSTTLGHGGSPEDILRALRHEGADLELLPDDEDLFTAVVRHRRVDSWTGGGNGEDGQPRPTRLAVLAGSVLRVKLAEGADRERVTNALAKIATRGLGDLRAQGYGRIVVGHQLLRSAHISVARPEEVAEEGGQEQ